MPRNPLSAVLIIIDSLRANSLRNGRSDGPATPFLDSLEQHTVAFRRAYATECWTLPTHLSMFTGLLPSEHRAHFRTMAYRGRAPTIAELFARTGYHTEVITRNSLFDGTVPGAIRGFGAKARPLAPLDTAAAPFAIVLALAKPRVRRLIRDSGFFHALQKTRRTFLLELARMGIPADRLALQHGLERMERLRRAGKPYFLFLNLYDVHAPYAPSETSPLRSFGSPSGWIENLSLPIVLPRVCGHAYLRRGFRLSTRSRAMLLRRYHRAIELMDAKLADFFGAARGAGLLDDTMIVVTSDHGEAFGEHGLYLHDASVYNTHLRVPLWIHHPGRAPGIVEDVVSTRDLFTLLRRCAVGDELRGTLLAGAARQAAPAALAEHFHYAEARELLPEYSLDLAAAVVGRHKAISRGARLELYDVERDPSELEPQEMCLDDVVSAWRRDGAPRAAIGLAAQHLRRWQAATAGLGRAAENTGAGERAANACAAPRWSA